MANSGEEENIIKTPVQKLVRDLTEKYVREMVKEASHQALQKRGDEFAEKLDFAWKGATEKDKEQILRELEDEISQAIQEDSTDAIDLQEKINSIMETKLDSALINPPQKSSKLPSGKGLPQGYLIKALLALLVISAGIYFALPIVFPAQLSINKTSLNFGIMGENTPSPLTFAISNHGQGTLSWNVYSTDSWIGLSPAAGKNNGLVEVSIKGTPGPGLHKGIIYVKSGNQKSLQIQVILQVKSPAEISRDPTTHIFTNMERARPARQMEVIAPAKLAIFPNPLVFSFEAYSANPPQSQTMRISNQGGEVLNWKISSNSWITAVPASGQLEGGTSKEVSIGIDIQNLDYSDRTGSLAIDSNGGSAAGRVKLNRSIPLR